MSRPNESLRYARKKIVRVRSVKPNHRHEEKGRKEEGRQEVRQEEALIAFGSNDFFEVPTNQTTNATKRAKLVSLVNRA